MTTKTKTKTKTRARTKRSHRKIGEVPGKEPESNGRGSPEAIAKRKVARRLNTIMSPRDTNYPDGRTENRRLATIEKLKATNGHSPKPIEALIMVDSLLKMGMKPGAIRKAGVRAVVKGTKQMYATLDEQVEMLKEVHAAYNFDPNAYRFVGFGHDAMVGAGLIPAGAPRRGRPPLHRD